MGLITFVLVSCLSSGIGENFKPEIIQSNITYTLIITFLEIYLYKLCKNSLLFMKKNKILSKPILFPIYYIPFIFFLSFSHLFWQWFHFFPQSVLRSRDKECRQYEHAEPLIISLLVSHLHSHIKPYDRWMDNLHHDGVPSEHISVLHFQDSQTVHSHTLRRFQ